MGTLFYILLTVHHVMILGKWPTWRTITFYIFIYIFNSLHVSSTSWSSSGETNLSLCRWPCRVQVGRNKLSLLMMSTMCSKHTELKINLNT